MKAIFLCLWASFFLLACSGDEVCNEEGGCVPVCREGETNCSGACVDLQTDPSHCGQCGKTCSHSCDGGVCSCFPKCQCVFANGLWWCFHPTACGRACNETCAAWGLAPVADTEAWFAAQDTVAECQAVSEAFGLGSVVEVDGYGVACLEDAWGDHASDSGLIAPLTSSPYAAGPSGNLTEMDQGWISCEADTNTRRSVCPCE